MNAYTSHLADNIVPRKPEILRVQQNQDCPPKAKQKDWTKHKFFIRELNKKKQKLFKKPVDTSDESD